MILQLPKDSTAWTWDSLSVEQQEKVKYHAGWATNRVREDTAASLQDSVFTVALTSSDSTPTSCTRGDLLQVVNRHGNYTTLDGRHRLVVVDVACPFFTSLHSTIHSVLSKDAIS